MKFTFVKHLTLRNVLKKVKTSETFAISLVLTVLLTVLIRLSIWSLGCHQSYFGTHETVCYLVDIKSLTYLILEELFRPTA